MFALLCSNGAANAQTLGELKADCDKLEAF
jgi:hypothetical protein